MRRQPGPELETRFWMKEELREDDERTGYLRDKSRVIHSSAFRRLQAKTQVMGVGEGDFHRTRLTHSIETAQIGEGILRVLKRTCENGSANCWLPDPDLLAAACLSHDLGHPPFGHGGEVALHRRMRDFGGFEANAQTLRILTRLEKYTNSKGINPTRRFILAVLKYPAPYSSYDGDRFKNKPPKCYFDSENDLVEWALSDGFTAGEVTQFRTEKDDKCKPIHRTLDCSIMEYADDIAYAVHDLEDIVARGMVKKEELLCEVADIFSPFGGTIGAGDKAISKDELESLYSASHVRKAFIGKLVHLFITASRLEERDGFVHPLLRFRVDCAEPVRALLVGLQDLTFDLVIRRAPIRQLERRGQQIINSLFEALVSSPSELIPRDTWESYEPCIPDERKVCDYIAGMTDPFAEKIYGRLFIPGQGSSLDEL